MSFDSPIPAGANTSTPPGVPPLLSAEPVPRPSSGRKFIAVLLSLFLVFFLADAALSLADDTLAVLFGLHWLGVVRGLISFLTLLAAVPIYGLMALAPMIPKRLFLPLVLFDPAAMLAVIPLLIFFYAKLPWIGWAVSSCQVLLGLVIFSRVAGGCNLRWPILSVEQLNPRSFNWSNLAGFVLVNLLVLVPATILYLAFGTALAVHHFSDGFMALRPDGITVQVRKYENPDGKVVELFPMAHVADTGFYRQVSQTFPSNSIILMEGVSDDRHLLTNKISYRRMARSLGLAEQHEEFKPGRGTIVRADVDVGQFSPETIDFLNVVMLAHVKGLTYPVLMQLAQYSPSPNFEEKLFADLLTQRNRHLLEEIQSHLPETDNLMVPWGAAHMPGIARELQQTGFHLTETHDYPVIRFHGFGSPDTLPGNDNSK